MDAEPKRFANDLIRLAFGPESLPGIPAWARAAARRFVGVSPEQLEAVWSMVSALGAAGAQQALADEMEKAPDAWGIITGLSLRVVSDLESDVKGAKVRQALSQTIEAQRRLNELDVHKAAAQGVSVEAEFLKHYGLGLAIEVEPELQAADSYRDLCGVVIWKWRDIATLGSRKEFCTWLDRHFGKDMVRTEKRLEHFCRLIGLRFRPPGRPKGKQNEPH